MSISSLFNSYAGMYMSQSFCHALIAAVIVDRAIHTWSVTDPLVKQRFRLIIVLFPIFSFPLYQVINPSRGSIPFRLDSLFDINRWLTLELWGKVPLGAGFVLVLSATTLVFIFQEMLPVLKHSIESRETEISGDSPASGSAVVQALEMLPAERPSIFILDDEEYILFSTTGRNPAIYLSTGLTEALSVDQIQAAVAHEIAHIARNKRPLLIAVFFLRVLMFFNPVVLLEFRKIVQEEEKICDDIAVSMTNKPAALAETLKKFRHQVPEDGAVDIKDLSRLGGSLEEYSHNLHLESRVERLEAGRVGMPGNAWTAFALTLASILAIGYFVV